MKEDQSSSLVWLGLAIFICIETIRELPLGSLHNPGAGFLPLGAGIIIGILSMINFLISTIRQTSPKWSWFPKEKWKSLVIIIFSLFLWAFFLDVLGFLVATFILLAFLLRAGEARWILAIGGAAAVSFTTYAIFDMWLRVQLPRGIWGF